MNVLLLHLIERRDEEKRLDHLKQDLRIGKKMRLVTHGLEGYEFENTCNNDKNLSEIQLEHEKEDELVALVVKVKFGWWFEQDISGENEDNNDKKLVMVNEGGRMS
ncbi:hypothetical protein Tco_0961098 [Tanacetum coccineum]